MNRRTLSFLLLLLLPLISVGQKELFQKHHYTGGPVDLPYRILYPEGMENGKSYPVLFFLHGAGERGNNNESQLVHGSNLFLEPSNRRKFPAIVVFPQCPKEDYWSNVERVYHEDGSREFHFKSDGEPTPAMGALLGLVDSISSLPTADKSRIYVGGLSMGGMGTFEVVNRRPELFAAAFPICGGANPEQASNYAGKVPFWIFHGLKDDIVPPDFSRIMAESIRSKGGQARLTLYPDANHNSWDAAFAEPGLLPWIFSKKKGKRASAQLTYCNPVDMDYSYMSHYAYRAVSYRSGADPSVVNFKGRFYMFVTRSHGYWYSDDLGTWTFVRPQSWYFNGSNAPAAAVYKDQIIALGDPSGIGAVITTDNPEIGDWQTTYSVLPLSIQDPDLFVDNDGRVYLYEESSNKWPIRGIELDPENMFVPVTKEQTDLFQLHPETHGWERFGQNHSSEITPFIEGPWMTRHEDTYYLEYSAPGTQWNVYADGVYTSKDPLGPFEYAPYNPVSYKPGGFLTGAGHGSTVKDNSGNYWHFASMAISVNYKFERRIGMFPAGFEADGQMYVNTAYGDYPHFLPGANTGDHKNRFTGWMLLSKDKPVSANSVVKGVEQIIVDEQEEGYIPAQEEKSYEPEMINDENIRTLWVANGNDESIHFTIDLGGVMQINAVQINFMDFNADVFGRPDTLRQQFIVEVSSDAKSWETFIDFSENTEDHPHAYIELSEPVSGRYVRYRNIYFPNKYLAISEFRVFGKGNGRKPAAPKGFNVDRQEDRRDAVVEWKPVKDAMGYVLYWGIRPESLNNSVMIYNADSYELKALNTDQNYYYQLEAFNENGISEKTKILSDD